jgi:hypothetical protein
VTTLTLDNGATNYVYLTSGGAITFNNGGPYPANSIPLARVVTAGGDITSITDDRCFFGEDTGAGGGGAPVGAQYLVLALDGTLTGERRFVPSTALSAVDAGANGDYTLSHAQVAVGDLHQDYVLAAGTRAFTGNQAMGGFKLTGLGAPAVGTDAANKTYVDGKKIAHILVFAYEVEDLAVGTLLPIVGICVGEAAEHGTFTAVPRGKAACRVAGVGTNTILIEADNAPAYGSAVTLHTLPLNALLEVDDTTLDNPWAAGDIWVRARCTALGGTPPKDVSAYFYFYEEVL